MENIKPSDQHETIFDCVSFSLISFISKYTQLYHIFQLQPLKY